MPKATDAPIVILIDDAEDAWWNKPKQELELFIRQRFTTANCVRLVVLDDNLKSLRGPIEVREPKALQRLAAEFEIVGTPEPAPIFDYATSIRIEIVGKSIVRFECIGASALYGPWGAKVRWKGAVDETNMGEWQTDGQNIAVNEWVYDRLWQSVKVSEQFKNYLNAQTLR